MCWPICAWPTEAASSKPGVGDHWNFQKCSAEPTINDIISESREEHLNVCCNHLNHKFLGTSQKNLTKTAKIGGLKNGQLVFFSQKLHRNLLGRYRPAPVPPAASLGDPSVEQGVAGQQRALLQRGARWGEHRRRRVKL